VGGDPTAAAGPQTAPEEISWPQARARLGRAGRILLVLKTGMAWGNLPQELGRGSGMTCWQR